MKLRLNKLMAGLVMAGGALALVGCGGGDAPTLVVQDDAVVAVSKAEAASTRALVAAGTGAEFVLPSTIDFQEVNGDTVVGSTTTAAKPVITFTTTADGSPDAVADFSMKDGTDTVTGTVDAGSCRYRVKTSTSSRFIKDKTYRILNCQLKALSNGAAVGSSVDAALQLILNNVASAPTTKKITITVTAGPNNTAVVTVNGTTIGSVPLPTGAART
ncbi:MAG: hypothetical protein Q8Q84_28805 [Hydrogenophaga sp.]|nr:hypothetical protein [Hydrogenophaga sp.]